MLPSFRSRDSHLHLEKGTLLSQRSHRLREHFVCVQCAWAYRSNARAAAVTIARAIE